MPIAEVVNKPTVYRLYDGKGHLLYVGATINVGSRMVQHRRTQPWWARVRRISVAHYPSRQEAEVAEALAIWRENPRFNVQRAAALDTDLAERDRLWRVAHRKCMQGSGEHAHGRDQVECR